MADISKINAVALANIAKLDAVLAANIAKVNGLVFTTAAPEFLLDTYTGAAAGYSVRRLATSATVLLRVRRDTAGGTGDDDEADVAYDSNNILSLDSAISNASVGVTATTLGQFLNVGTVNGTTYTNPDSLTVTASCYVDTWYDQAGSNDAEQATEANQPQIHDGTVNTDLITENGKPAVDFDGTNDILRTQNLSGGHDWFSIFSVYEKEDTNVRALYNYGLLSGGSGSTDLTLLGNGFTAGTAQIQYSETASTRLISTLTPSTYTTPGQYLTSIFNKSTAATSADQFGFVNGAAPSVTVAADNTPLTTQYQALPLNIGGHGINDARRFWNGTIQEAIFYPSDQDGAGNRTGIEENINSEYLIYQPTDAPTSGLLATYTGAAAAYSVRQLSDKAVIAITVRRDSDDEEQRFGFDANGDLDTTAISDFCGTANVYVTRWWDQSTNGNHATQSTSGNQPQIYNGTAVITENGKPALQWDGVNDGLAFSLPAMNTWTAHELFWVNQSSDGTAIMLRGGPNNPWLHISQTSTSTNVSDWLTPGNDYTAFRKDGAVAFTSSTTRTQYKAAYYDGNQHLVTVQGTPNTGAFTTSSFSIGDYSGFQYAGTLQELIMYVTTDQGSNVSAIETDIMTYFSIP